MAQKWRFSTSTRGEIIGFLKVSPPVLVMIGGCLVLAMRARGAPSTKTDGKIGESSKAFGDGTKTT
jgi:hypothetical protein